jgi:hypothetical protein
VRVNLPQVDLLVVHRPARRRVELSAQLGAQRVIGVELHGRPRRVAVVLGLNTDRRFHPPTSVTGETGTTGSVSELRQPPHVSFPRHGVGGTLGAARDVGLHRRGVDDEP